MPVQRLQEERVSLTQRQDSFKQLLEEMNQKYEALKTKLQENETHAQVSTSAFFTTVIIKMLICCLFLTYCIYLHRMIPYDIYCILYAFCITAENIHIPIHKYKT